jgi:tape measure domain-containing protein
MPSIDERVVAMAFENQVFEQRVSQTIATLGKLDTAIKSIGQTNGLQDIEKAASKVTLQGPMSALDKLKSRLFGAGQGAAQGMGDIEKAGSKVTLQEPMSALDKLRTRLFGVGSGATDGFNQIEKASDRVHLGGVTKAVDTVMAKFSVLQGAASVALGNIVTQAGQKGAAFAKSFSFGPIQQGFQEYQTNLGSIQTVMANTEGQRVSGLKATNNALNELNRYSDKTIYNFSEMARNVGTFTAAGVDLKTSVASIKGIANLAALSGSNSQQASTAMYQLSQAIASGKVGLQDWNSVVNAGMGGRKFQNSLIQTGLAMGTIEKGAVKIDKATGKATVNGQSFRESIMAKPGQQSWLTSEVLTGSLSQFTGDMTDAQLAAKGFTAEQIKSIQATAKSAQAAATQVKTLPQVFDVAKEAIGSGWAQTFSAVFGNFNQAKKTFTELSNFINGHINASAKARNKMLADWNKLGGRETLIKGIKQAFQDLGAILKPIKDAFRDIFPAKTGKQLFDMTKGFADLMKHLKPSAATIDGLHRTFRGLFSLFSIGWYVVKKVVGVFADLLGIAGKGGGGFLKFTGGIGDFLTAMQKAIVKGDALKGLFQGITNVLRVPLEILKSLGSAFAGLFDHADKGSKAIAGVGNVSDKLKPLVGVLGNVIEFGKRAIKVMNKLFEPITTFVNKVGHAFIGIGQTIADAFKNADTSAIFSAIQTGFLGGIFLAIRKAIGGGGNFIVNPMKKLSGALDMLTGNLKAMQQAIKAHTLLAIAAAIGILAVGILILSKIDPKRLTAALSGMAVGMGELVGMLYLIDTSAKAVAGLPLLGIGLIGVATAVTILAAAMKIFSTMSWEDIVKGLVGVGGALISVSVGVKAMSGPQMLALGPALLLVAAAMNVLAVAMKIFAGFSWGEIVKGIVGMGGALLALGIGLKSMGPSITLVAPGLIGVAIGLTLMSGAIAAFGKMNFATLIQGVLGIAGAVVIIGTALREMPSGPMMIAQAAGLTLAALALTGIAGAVKLMGSMNLATMAKGLVTLGASLFELSVGLDLMSGTLPGAAALLAAAAALAILAPTLGILGALPFPVILKGLAVMAGVLGVLGVVGLVATEGIAALGIALGVLGIGILGIGLGVWLIVKALIALGDASIKSTGILIAAITAFIISIPKMVVEFLKGLVVIVENIAKVAPQVVVAMSKIIDSIIQVVINSTPKLAQAIIVLLGAFIHIVDTKAGPLVDAGIRFFLHFLTGVASNIGKITTQAALIVIRFLAALTAKLPDLIKAGAKFIVTFLNGLSSHIGDIVGAAGKLIANFLLGVANALPHIVAAGGRVVVKFLLGIANALPDMITAGFKVITQFINGIANNLWRLRKSAENMVKKFLNNVAKALVNSARIAFDALIDFMNGLANVIHDKAPELRKAAKHLAWEVIDAFTFGLAGKFKTAFERISNPDSWASTGSTAVVIPDVKPPKGGRRHAPQNWHLGKPPKHRKMAADPNAPAPFVFAHPKTVSDQGVAAGQNVMNGVSAGIKKGLPNTKKTMAGAASIIVQAAKPPPLDSAHAFQAEDYFGTLLGQSIVSGMRAGLLGMAGAMQEGVTGPIRALLAKNHDLHAFGAFLGGEFRKGLTGGLWDDGKSEARKQIEGAFAALKAKLGEEQGKLRDRIKQDQDKLKQLLGDKSKNWNQINALRSNIANEKGLLAAAKASSRELIAGMAGEQAVLIKLAAKYQYITTQLDNAKQKLADLKQTRDDAIRGYIDQFSALPDIASLLDSAMSDAAMTYQERWDAQRKKQDEDRQRSQIDQVANYKKALQDQIAATQKYMETLTALRALKDAAGNTVLDDATYKKLLDMGTAGQAFASQLLAKGPAAIQEISGLDSQLTAVASQLGKGAAKELYQNGIDMAKGLVDGLKQEQKDIRDIMTGIAKSMVIALKLALGIRSPSRVFAELGQYSMLGLAQGLKDSAPAVGDEAANALTNSLANISDRVQNGINTDVTITPVLDLSQVQKDASQLQDLSNVVPITAAASYGQAAAISNQQQAASDAQTGGGDTIIDVKLEQTNTSPKALDDIEIYRQTKNQLSQVKGALGLVNATNP